MRFNRYAVFLFDWFSTQKARGTLHKRIVLQQNLSARACTYCRHRYNVCVAFTSFLKPQIGSCSITLASPQSTVYSFSKLGKFNMISRAPYSIVDKSYLYSV